MVSLLDRCSILGGFRSLGSQNRFHNVNSGRSNYSKMIHALNFILGFPSVSPLAFFPETMNATRSFSPVPPKLKGDANLSTPS